MSMQEEIPYPIIDEPDYATLQSELAAAHANNRKLQRQIKKIEQAAEEAKRAHSKMVETLTETMRENTLLTVERDMWKGRAQRRETDEQSTSGPTLTIDIAALIGIDYITAAEARAIRKAVARVHHPDSGGDVERMKQWNAALDQIKEH